MEYLEFTIELTKINSSTQEQVLIKLSNQDLVEIYSKFLISVKDVGELSQPQTEVHSRNRFEEESNLFKYSRKLFSINSSLANFHTKILVFKV